MVDSNNMDALAWLRKQLDGDENDLLREMVREFCERAAEVAIGDQWNSRRVIRALLAVGS